MALAEHLSASESPLGIEASVTKMKLKLPNSNKLSNSFKKWGLGAAAVALALSLSVGCDVAYCAAQKPKSDLDKLEMKYFQHMYPENDNAARLRRLEKMVFGEEKTGTEQERLASILATVPDLGEEEAAPPPKATAKGSDDDSSQSASAPESAEESGDVGDYPAVTAIEKHLFGKEFSSEPVGGRLARLEKKQFGKVSTSEDLSERVDALKMATSVDVTKKKPAGSEWAEEEEADDGSFPAPSRHTAQDYPGSGIAEPGEDGRSFSGRDLRKDFERAGLRKNASGGYSSSGSYGSSGSSGIAGGGSGSYGMSGGGSYGSGSGSYGMGAGSSGSYGSGGGGFSGGGNRRVAQAPRTAPKSQDSYDPDNAPPTGGSAGASPGLTRQIDALEKEVFGKTFGKSKTLSDRVSDLEKTIFPQDTKAIAGISMEDRVARMTAVIPIAAPNNVAQQPYQQQPTQQQQYDPYNDPNMTANNGMPRRGGGGLGKIINSLGSFINGGMSVGGMGGYPMTGGYGSPYGSTYVDPTTGMVIRQNVPYMTNPYGGGLGGFNNGFSSPYYSPYSNPMGGMGGSGIRFGTGGFGSSSGFGGTWP